MSELEFTGKRYVPSESGRIKIEHLHRYYFTSSLIKNKTVLDIACGEGFGSSFMADYAREVIGVDIDAQTVKHARKKYKKNNLNFKTGDCKKIPVPDNSIDVAVSFETIEHHPYHREMLQEFKRVLKPGGVLVISSPNKLIYSDLKNYTNPFHVKELYKEDFIKLLKEYFLYTDILGQKVIYGSAILADEKVTEFKVINDQQGIDASSALPSPEYDLAVCSDAQVPPYYTSLLEDSIDNSDQVKQYEKSLAEANDNIIDPGQHTAVSKDVAEIVDVASDLIKSVLKIDDDQLTHTLEPFAKVSNFKDFDTSFKKVVSRNKIIEKELYSSPTVSSYSIRGFCIPCNRQTAFLVDNNFGATVSKKGWLPNWRERLVCPHCRMNNRQRLFATIIKKLFVNTPATLLLLETPSSIQKWLSHHFKNIQCIGRPYLGYLPPTVVPENINHEDLNKLSFNDNYLDGIYGFDNLMYCPDPAGALSECCRALKPGGRFIATVPFNYGSEVSRSKATVHEGQLNIVTPGVYHSSAVSGHKMLLFNDFGWDILDLAQKAGFQKTSIEIYYSVKYGHLGHGNFVFSFIKKK